MATRGTIVLVPGFAGNNLLLPPGHGWPFDFKVWFSLARLPGYYQRLRWGSDWRTFAGPAVWDYYGPITDGLRAAGWTVVEAALDWRGPVAADASTVADLVNVWFTRTRQPVHLLGHSRGGLVMRLACQILSFAGLLPRVGKCVTIACPHRGTLSAASLLGTVNDTLCQLYTWFRVVAGWRPAQGQWDDLVSVVNSWPGLYELLPDPRHPWPSPGEQNTTLAYDRLHYQGVALIHPEYLTAAKDTAWPLLPNLPQTVPWLDIVGTGVMTAAGSNGGWWSDPTAYVYDSRGDGTVWLPALADWPAPGLVLNGVGHDRLPQDGRAIAAASSFFAS